MNQDPIYAAIDLGSNSFHMLIVREVNDSIQIIGKIKRKVRLAAGLDANNILALDAMARGWDCLSLFAERLQDLPTPHVRIVGTAALRLAENVQQFLDRAEEILGHKINIISGEEEAKLIYVGVAHTSGAANKKLVIDIGGASTELIAGRGFTPKTICSLDMGCVTYLKRFFSNDRINKTNFSRAISAAQDELETHKNEFINHGWHACLGASGTLQAIQECLIAQGQSEIISLKKLEALKQQAMECNSIELLGIVGLANERRPVFVSGLAILIAIFKSFNIKYMVLAGGALREGLIYGMIPHLQQVDIRSRTTHSFIQRYQLDHSHAHRVKDVATYLFKQITDVWDLEQHDGLAVLEAAALLHEVGLSIDYKYANKHGAYILSNTAIPGFSLAQRKLLIALVRNHKDDISLDIIKEQTMTNPLLAQHLTCLLRLAILLSMRRLDEALPKVTLSTNDKNEISLSFEKNWLRSHPLMESELAQECEHLKKITYILNFN